MSKPSTRGTLLRAGLVLLWLLAPGPAAPADAASIEQLEQDVRQCAACHGEDGRSTQMPWNGRIAGQYYEYLVYILRQYRAGRVRGLNGSVMAGAVAHLDDARIKALARYYSTLD